MNEQTEAVGLIQDDHPDARGPEEPVDEHRRNIVLVVYAPRDPDPKRFSFRLDMTVGDAATEAAEKFGYDASTPTFKRRNGDVLDRALTLREAGLRHREEVDLVDVGGGV